MSITRRAALAVLATVTGASADPLTIVERPNHTTEATVVVDASPQRVYDLCTDYAHWKNVFHDIESVSVERGDRNHARVRFSSRALQHEVTVQFDNEPGRAIHFKGVEGPPGGRASGSYVLTPVDGGRRTQVDAKLYMEVVGPVGWFVSDSKVRSMRQAKVRADLGDAARVFAQVTAR
jgi:hypothetical protein